MTLALGAEASMRKAETIGEQATGAATGGDEQEVCGNRGRCSGMQGRTRRRRTMTDEEATGEQRQWQQWSSRVGGGDDKRGGNGGG